MEKGVCHICQGLPVVDGHRAWRPLGYYGFQPLGAHHCPGPVVASHMASVAYERREARQVLAGRPDAEDACLAFIHSQLPRQEVDHIPGVHSSQVISVPQFCLPIVNIEILEALGHTLYHQAIEAIEPHIGSQEAIGLAGGRPVGQRPLGDDRDGARAVDSGAAQGAGGYDQPVLWVRPLHTRRHLLVKHLGSIAAAAQMLPISGPLQLFGPDPAAGQVYTQELASIALLLLLCHRSSRLQRSIACWLLASAEAGHQPDGISGPQLGIQPPH